MTQARFANVSEVPLALGVFLASDSYDYDNTPNTISATTLLRPLRQVILQGRVPPGDGLVNLADMMSNRMGAAIHDGIEKAWLNNHVNAMKALGIPQKVINQVRINPEPAQLDDTTIPIYLEQRSSRQCGQWKVTGKYDFVGDGMVQDFKSTSTFTYKKQTNTDKYIQQGSIYRWLNPDVITGESMQIHYIFTDWKPSMVRSDPSYPPRRFHTQSFPLMSLQETQRFIERKLALIETHLNAPEDMLPECSDEELWRSEPVFKYYKNPEKTQRSTKNFDSRADAMVQFVTDGSKGIVKEVPGRVMACKYCPAFAACSQKDRLIASGDLDMGG